LNQSKGSTHVILRKLSIALFAVALTGAATPAGVITARQDAYKQIGKANKGINDELRKPAPAMAAIQANATILDTLAPRVPSWFPKGSGPEAGVKTAALPAIWQRNPEFQAAARNFAAAAHNFRAAAASGDVNRVRAAAPALGAACHTCHETFRARD
jgi:cytochrome c556